MESILTSVKKLLGITAEDTSFDMDIILHINSVFMILNQLGVGPPEGFSISDELSTWEDFTDDNSKWESVKTYVYLKVKLIFDPPLASSVIAAYKEEIAMLEWRLNVASETPSNESEVV